MALGMFLGQQGTDLKRAGAQRKCWAMHVSKLETTPVRTVRIVVGGHGHDRRAVYRT